MPTVAVKAVGPVPGAVTPSGLKVPVKGAPVVANVNGLVEVELTVVLVKLSPEPPLAFTRFKTAPFGATKFIVKSEIQVCVILKLTDILLILDPAGKVAVKGEFIPVALASGITIFTGPLATLNVALVPVPVTESL